MPDAATAAADRHRLLGMTDDEYAAVLDLLGREPTDVELAMYAAMWSEHCSYKSSRLHLRRFPTDAPWVRVGPGENAGVIDLGDGWLAALRIESHNHPSFVEPYQGAATGVGGIVRDVFTMGARPVALWNAIRFGPLDEARNRYLFDGVVAGIGGYGNAVGVPTVGGEIEFDPCYGPNPLVNVMCLGVMREDQLVLGQAGAPGTVAVLLGAPTGRDGIGGASVLASASFDADAAAKRPSVQVGDPFEEKKLIEACLELYRRGLVAGIQDLGAAGLACGCSEPAARAGVGLEVDLERVRLREAGMAPAEVLTSESQERMLAFVAPDDQEEVMAVAARWEIDAVAIGTVAAGDRLVVRSNGVEVADVPASSLTEGAPLLDRPARRPEWLDGLWSLEPVSGRRPDVGKALLELLDDPGVGDPRWVFERYDHMLFGDTVVGPGHDGALIRIKGTGKALAASVDGNGSRCLLDPRRGGARLVHEGALNVAATGARPRAVVDNLNFGNPEKPEVMWQFLETVAGISEACEALGLPVIGGNVSFYNETDGGDIHPTPVVGVVGLADPMPAAPPRLDRAEAGMGVWLLGTNAGQDLAGGAYARVVDGRLGGRPAPPDHPAGAEVMEGMLALAAAGTPVLHDVSTGGMAVGLAEICIASGVGATIDARSWQELFCEAPHRALAVASPELVAAAGIEARLIGEMGGSRIDLGDWATVELAEASAARGEALPKRMRR